MFVIMFKFQLGFYYFKGPVIIYHLEGGVGGFWGDHLIFRRTEGGISRN